jgi:hypothetical protein
MQERLRAAAMGVATWSYNAHLVEAHLSGSGRGPASSATPTLARNGLRGDNLLEADFWTVSQALRQDAQKNLDEWVMTLAAVITGRKSNKEFSHLRVRSFRTAEPV